MLRDLGFSAVHCWVLFGSTTLITVFVSARRCTRSASASTSSTRYVVPRTPLIDVEVLQVGHVTCDNASNNDTKMEVFAELLVRFGRTDYNAEDRRVRYVSQTRPLHLFLTYTTRCAAHTINLATQEVLKTYSKSIYYNPHDPDADLIINPPLSAAGANDVTPLRDEVGLLRMITVKVYL